MAETFKRFSYTLLAILIIALSVWLGITLADNGTVTRIVSAFGYVGLFGAAIVSGFNVVVPIPLIAFVPTFVASGLMFWPVVIVITLGMTLGDALGFFIGHAGRKITETSVERSKFTNWLLSFARRYPKGAYVLLFFYATLAPAPNEVVVVPMAFLGYRLKYMAPIVLVGNFVFNTLVSLGVLQVASLF